MVGSWSIRSKVKVSRNALNYFRTKARNTDKEIEAYLVGKVVSAELTVIEKIVYPKKYEKQTPGEVKWFDKETDALKATAEEQGLSVIGSIHSHPNYWPVISGTDHDAHVTEQVRIMGVCGVMNRKTMVCFWVTESCLPCKIIYE
jgi:proteasome lid subunit RPN8/RPN11